MDEGPVLRRGLINLAQPGQDNYDLVDLSITRVKRTSSVDEAVDGEDEAYAAKRPKTFGGKKPIRRASSMAPFKVPWKVPPAAWSDNTSAGPSVRPNEPKEASSGPAPMVGATTDDLGLDLHEKPHSNLSQPDPHVDQDEGLIQLTNEQKLALVEDLEIDVAFSEKIPITAREDGLETILSALRHSLLERRDAAEQVWEDVQRGGRSLDGLKRAHVVRKCAIRLEFNAMSYAANTEGYVDKVGARSRAAFGLGLGHRKTKEIEECLDCLKGAVGKTR
ncbi:uncharacterized protein EI90DRAFT_3065486 [Cantharellus anzutake]|uniref:uncharacterized protein n=1 Tax=Cantharellus anzutake TaxID=1750568 RepID=UPI001907670C|nr:uncharacterized protein EI90DRAFT_3065486 [Cantharellus anzutake]KAF8328071.1 hypothetical protein EI90DRAFT_3065486 [Cantharellus anzutake]